MKPDWTIREESADWECSWKANEAFQLRYFRALPFVDKLRAVENMCTMARFLQDRAKARRHASIRKAMPSTTTGS